jgi:hypothetical protein
MHLQQTERRVLFSLYSEIMRSKVLYLLELSASEKWEDLGWARWLKPIILVTWEVKIRRICIRGQPEQKVCESPISTNSWTQWHTLVITATQESTNRRILVQA